MHDLFSEIQISKQAHKGRQYPARLRPVKSFNGCAELIGSRRRHQAKLANEWPDNNRGPGVAGILLPK